MKFIFRSNPYKPLLSKKTRNSGRRSNGSIAVWHKGGGHKRLLRLIDFKRNKVGVHGKIERFEYDPNRSSHIALVLYEDGSRNYIIAPEGLAVSDSIISGTNAPLRTGNSLPICFIPSGTHLHCIELQPGQGAKVARAAGAFIILISNEGPNVKIKLKSGEIRLVSRNCAATIGEVGNAQHNLIALKKAGRARWLGIRPTVRGVAMNPIDHPHGGGEGKTTAGRHPVSPWGTPTKGFKTRRNKLTNRMIITRRDQ